MWKRSLLLLSLRSWSSLSWLSPLLSLFQGIASFRSSTFRKRAPKNLQAIEWDLVPYSFRLEWYEMKDPSGPTQKVDRQPVRVTAPGESSPANHHGD